MCFMGIHKWNKWSEITTGYDGLTQFRCCSKCNKIKYRGIYGNQVKPDIINSLLLKTNEDEKK